MDRADDLPETSRSLGLDAVRALAIALVLVGHWTGTIAWWLGYGIPPRWVLVSGFFGVELFFALSGFLIGGLLLDLIERTPTLGGWARFMARRWLRTLPLYAVCLVVLAVLWRPAEALIPTVAAYATLTQNLLWAMPADNWFGVSWSLTVEEWFYLLFSAALIGGVALTGRKNACVWAVIALFVVVPVVLRWQVPDTVPVDIGLRKETLLRLDAITYGVAMAKLCRDRHRLVARPGLLLAIGLAIVLERWFGPSTFGVLSLHVVRTFGLAVVPLACALCLPAAVRLRQLPRAAAWLARTLSRLSYAIYLVHLSVLEALSLAFVRAGVPGWVCIVASVIAIFGLAVALNRFVEAPIMARRPAQYVGSGARVQGLGAAST